MISLSTPKLRKKLFWTNKKFVFFFKCSNLEKLWKKLVKQIGEFVTDWLKNLVEMLTPTNSELLLVI